MIDNLVDESIDLLRQWEPPTGYYLAFSGGKDSITMLRLCDMAGVKYTSHYSCLGLDHKELMAFIRTEHPTVEWLRPKRSLMALMKTKKILPTRFRRWCCDLKHTSPKNVRLLTGVRKQESSKRAILQCANYDNRSKEMVIRPIFRWKDTDVWQFIADQKLKYCSLYDAGYKRLGCVACPLLAQRDRLVELERHPWAAAWWWNAAGLVAKARTLAGKVDLAEQAELYDWWKAQP